MRIHESTAAKTNSSSSSSTSARLEQLGTKVSQSLHLLTGREYHPDKTIPYLLPCDEQECERLTLQHYVLRHAFGSNVIPPIDTTLGGKVLDCGCGPGTWLVEMAMEYEDLEFYGFDISTMYPSNPPKNAHFSYGNLLSPQIPFPSDTFLLVHQRNMLLALPQEAWPAVIDDLYRTLRPNANAYLQLCEVDPFWCRTGPQSRALLALLDATACHHHLLHTNLPHHLDALLTNAGCQHVHMLMVEIPIGQWGGHLGRLWQLALQAEISALKPIVLQAALDAQIAQGADRAVVGAEMITAHEWDHMMDAVWAEMDQYRTFSRVYLAYGQKP